MANRILCTHVGSLPRPMAMVPIVRGDEPEPAFTTFGDACAAIPDCDAPRDVEPGPSERIFRVLLARDDAGAITIEQVETVDDHGLKHAEMRFGSAERFLVFLQVTPLTPLTPWVAPPPG